MPISPHQLVGRDRDVSLLRSFVVEAAEDGGALLVTGDAGVGKTALLNKVAGEARRGGARVLRAAGAEFEAALSFAGLGQLLQPVLGQLAELDEIDQRALHVSLGLTHGTASEEHVVAVATLRLLVLVHGGFVDGSGWRGVYDLLTADGFSVSVVQNQTLSLESDVETTTNVLDLQDGPTILVGHSYGGAVISESGTHDSVAGLVYVCAFAPDQGESVSSLLAGLPADGPVPPILAPVDGFLFLDREKFADAFAADVPAGEAAFMADSQVPWGVEALNGMVTDPAWRSKPSWYMVTTEDRMIPPPLQRTMAERAGATTTEVSGSHAVYVSQPSAVAGLVTQAARSVPAASSVA